MQVMEAHRVCRVPGHHEGRTSHLSPRRARWEVRKLRKLIGPAAPVCQRPSGERVGVLPRDRFQRIRMLQAKQEAKPQHTLCTTLTAGVVRKSSLSPSPPDKARGRLGSLLPHRTAFSSAPLRQLLAHRSSIRYSMPVYPGASDCPPRPSPPSRPPRPQARRTRWNQACLPGTHEEEAEGERGDRYSAPKMRRLPCANYAAFPFSSFAGEPKAHEQLSPEPPRSVEQPKLLGVDRRTPSSAPAGL